MSLSLMIQAFKTKVNNPVRKLILIKLADNANDLGECWPSHQHIADQCEVSKRTVIYHIKALEESGLIHKENRFKNNEQQSNMYTLFPSGANNSPTGCSKNTHGVQDIHPRGADNSRGTGAESAHRINHSSEPSNEPPIEPKEANGDKSPSQKFDAMAYLMDQAVPYDLAEDFIKHRKATKSMITKRVIDNIASQAAKANYTLEQAIDTLITKGWKSFNADWVNKPQAGAQGTGGFNYVNKQVALEQSNMAALEEFRRLRAEGKL